MSVHSQEPSGQTQEPSDASTTTMLSFQQILALFLLMFLQGCSSIAFLAAFPLPLMFLLAMVSPAFFLFLILNILHRHWLLQQQSERTFLNTQMIWMRTVIHEGQQQQRKQQKDLLTQMEIYHLSSQERTDLLLQHIRQCEQRILENIELTRIRRQRRQSSPFPSYEVTTMDEPASLVSSKHTIRTLEGQKQENQDEEEQEHEKEYKE